MSNLLRVLLVEDNPGDADLISELLPGDDSLTFEIEHVPRLTVALKRVRVKPFDIILLDLGLPDSSGLDTVRVMSKGAADIPIVVMTGNSDEQLGVAAIQNGAQDFVVKGEVSSSLLVRILRYAFERHQSAQQLRTSEARYRNLIDSQSDIIARSDPKGFLTFVNDSYCQTFGKSREQLLGKTFTPTVFHEDLRISENAIEKAKKPPYRSQSETRHITPQGLLWFSWENSALLNENGKVIELQGVGRDITQRKTSEEALRKSEENFRNLFENSTVGLYRTSPDGEILLANPTLVKMLGYESFEDLAKRNLEKDGFEPGYKREEFKKLFKHDTFIHGLETAWRKEDGTNIHVRESTKAILDANGKVQYYEGTVEDITERKKSEENLERSTLELKARNEELERFYKAAVGRELRMIELKKQTNALSKKLGQSAPYPNHEESDTHPTKSEKSK